MWIYHCFVALLIYQINWFCKPKHHNLLRHLCLFYKVFYFYDVKNLVHHLGSFVKVHHFFEVVCWLHAYYLALFNFIICAYFIVEILVMELSFQLLFDMLLFQSIRIMIIRWWQLRKIRRIHWWAFLRIFKFTICIFI